MAKERKYIQRQIRRNISDRLKRKFENINWAKTALKNESLFRQFLKGGKIKTCLEIGTFQGLSAALLSQYAKRIITIDIRENQYAEQVWDFLNVKNKIDYILVENNREKRKIIEKLDFDFAFIDGSCDFQNIVSDFVSVKNCGKVLFHNFNRSEVKKAINSFKLKNLKIKDSFAYWQGKGKLI